MKITQVAAQLYTVRDFAKTPAEIAQALKRVRAMGYTAVQVSGIGPIEPAELRRMLDGEGLTCCATHEDMHQILKDPAPLIEKLKALGCGYTAYPFPAGFDVHDEDSMLKLAAELNRVGELFHRAEITLSYHNHQLEFARLGSRTALDVIFANTDPAYLHAEIDTYWVQYGGGVPQDWCTKLAGRLSTIHMKDYGIDAKNSPVFKEIGAGNLNWPAIIRAAEGSGCHWFIVEQDVCPGDPFDSLKQSFDYIQAHLVEA